jgi:hypothetical protein
MHAAFLVAAVVALAGAVPALLTKRGDGAQERTPGSDRTRPGKMLRERPFSHVR